MASSYTLTELIAKRRELDRKRKKKVGYFRSEEFRGTYDRYQQSHAEARKQRRKRYDAEHREMHAVDKHKRRTQTKEGDLTTEQWLELVEECGGMCVKCAAPYEHMDHIIPLSKGGEHTLDNVQPLCAKCNLSKHNRLESKDE